MQQRLTTIIRGVIIPAGWDEEGNVTDVAISARNEIEYRIERAAGGRELMRLLNREVEVSGEVVDTKDGKTIVIAEYNVLGRQ